MIVLNDTVSYILYVMKRLACCSLSQLFLLAATLRGEGIRGNLQSLARAWTGVVDFERGLFIIIYAPPPGPRPTSVSLLWSSKYNPIIHTSSIVHPPLPCYLSAGCVPGRVAKLLAPFTATKSEPKDRQTDKRNAQRKKPRTAVDR